ncbi:hypothetical protein [Halosolutus halophilus]|uniref:hypothetical protein n=1 Tax=Halosolutus halophilus TaxID=1552990 RepID=UPI002234FBD1|nr:hypothetical protein [Halosolutus halophilus]
MIGAFTVGKKAVTFGYKRYGIPGAIASGGIALAGYVAVRRALRSMTASDDESIDSAIDAATIKNAIDADGLGAVADPATLDEAIDAEQLVSDVEMDDLTSSVTEQTDAVTEGIVDDESTGETGDDLTEGVGGDESETDG